MTKGHLPVMENQRNAWMLLNKTVILQSIAKKNDVF